ncbi:hypothetical protein EN814_16295 [Mesorhizobium sp. M2D.F.Ca.ET.171.01.1.1]|uniref:hypothetical protein n=1 Tax=unclassified Mesorhizobium TaxID=325217 RepID=UPI0010918712|nr:MULTISPECIES: hypothetical protein [unclassified Mesorhizobium]TGS95262.1 hypothetical protein EN821_16310 [Mesorhizobium sp. M2D.F.Ca.ET.178.01.1.1]TGT10801.1 hypothetical protein EN814_16295 [Mesorhizobium sp. M2D.F.Ca.ET.171.01.1.1]
MYWKRGFFRLWLLCATLWIAAAFYLGLSGGPIFPELRIGMTREGKIIASSPPWTDGARMLDSMADSGLSERQPITGYPGAATYYADPADDQATKTAKLIKVRVYVESERSRTKFEYLKSSVYFGVLPPLLLLALGVAIGWAFAGFRRGPNLSGPAT